MILRKYQSILLWTCQALFMLRVFGQGYVNFYAPVWLPPMEDWYSGLIPYSVLLPLQIFIILLMTKVSYDNTRKSGYFYVTNTKTKTVLVGISLVYSLIMAIRYAASMILFPEKRWLRGIIPIFFHWVLAFYIYLLAHDSK